jgi:hypothetical protein
MQFLINLYFFSAILSILYAVFFYVIDDIDTGEFFAGVFVSIVPVLNSYIALAAIALVMGNSLTFIFDMIYLTKERIAKVTHHE